MANTIKVEIVSAEEEVWSGEGTMVFAPAEMGEIGVAPQHAPLLTRLKPGEIRVQQEAGEEQFFFVSGGLLEVQGHLVTVLSDTALRAGDLDEAAALEAQRRAEQATSVALHELVQAVAGGVRRSAHKLEQLLAKSLAALGDHITFTSCV